MSMGTARAGRGAHLRRVRVHNANVLEAQRALQHDLLHVLALGVEAVPRQVLVAHDPEELEHVAQQLLRNALARRVDADLHRRRGKQHRRREHRHADRLPEPARRADQHLLRQVLPRVDAQHRLVVPLERPGGLCFPENPRACFLPVYLRKFEESVRMSARGTTLGDFTTNDASQDSAQDDTHERFTARMNPRLDGTWSETEEFDNKKFLSHMRQTLIKWGATLRKYDTYIKMPYAVGSIFSPNASEDALNRYHQEDAFSEQKLGFKLTEKDARMSFQPRWKCVSILKSLFEPLLYPQLGEPSQNFQGDLSFDSKNEKLFDFAIALMNAMTNANATGTIPPNTFYILSFYGHLSCRHVQLVFACLCNLWMYERQEQQAQWSKQASRHNRRAKWSRAEYHTFSRHVYEAQRNIVRDWTLAQPIGDLNHYTFDEYDLVMCRLQFNEKATFNVPKSVGLLLDIRATTAFIRTVLTYSITSKFKSTPGTYQEDSTRSEEEIYNENEQLYERKREMRHPFVVYGAQFTNAPRSLRGIAAGGSSATTRSRPRR